MIKSGIIACLLLLLGSSVYPALYQLKVLTDNTPDVSDIVSYIRSINGPWQTTEEKCIMSWKWETCVRHQTTSATENGAKITDMIRALNNYGSRVCGTTSEELCLVWKGMGLNNQRRGWSGHTVPEVFYDGKWHMYDAAFGFFYRDKVTGEVMGIDSIRNDLTMTTFVSPVTTFEGIGGYAIYEPSRSNSGEMTEFNSVPSTATAFSSAAYRCNIAMRPFESYKRTWLELGDTKDYYTPYLSDESDPNDGYLAPFVRSNGDWILEPDFSTADYRKCILAESHTALDVSPRLHPDAAGISSTVDFKIDAGNVITSAVITGSMVCGSTADTARIFISTDNGTSFQEVWRHTGSNTVQAAVQAALAQKYSYIVRVEMKAASAPASVGLNTLKIETITQLNQRTLPALTLGSNRVMLKLGTQQAGAKFEPVEVTYQWKEFRAGGVVTRTHVERVTDSAGPHEYYINVGGWRNPDMQFVALNFQGYNPLGNVTVGYSDGVDVGAIGERPRYFVAEGLRDLAYRKKYTATPAATNDPALTRLTDGNSDYNKSGTWAAGVIWPANANPVITINLDTAKVAGGVRVLEAVGADSGEYADSIIVLTSSDSINFSRQGKMDEGEVWAPPVNYLLPARWDSRENRGYKYWGIFIHRFNLAFDSAVQCRFVQFRVFNSARMSIMEAEVRDSLMKKQLALNELNNGFTLPDPTGIDEGRIVLPAAREICLAVSPNPFSREIKINYYAGNSDPVRVSVYDVQGRCVKALFSGTREQGWHQVLWNGQSSGNTPMPAGVYVLRLETGKKSWAHTLVLIR